MAEVKRKKEKEDWSNKSIFSQHRQQKLMQQKVGKDLLMDFI